MRASAPTIQKDVDYYLSSMKVPPASDKKLVFKFLRRLIEIFGEQYKEQVTRKLGKSMKAQYLCLLAACNEVQDQLAGIEVSRENLNKYLAEYRILKCSDSYLTKKITKTAYESLACPQEILTHPKPDSARLKKIEKARAIALMQLGAKADPPEDAKKNEEEKAAGGNRVELSVDEKEKLVKRANKEKKELAKLCYNRVAVIWNGIPVSFFTLLRNWGQAKQIELPFAAWIVDSMPAKFFELKPVSFWTYRKEIIFEMIEKKIGVRLSSAAKNKISELFYDDEVQGDLVYFIGNRGLLESKKLREQIRGRSSQDLILSMRRFRDIVSTFGVKQEKKSALFDMVLCGNPDLLWKPSEQIQSEEDPRFSASWDYFEQLLSAVYKRKISLQDPAPEDRQLLSEYRTAPLFFVFLNHPKSELFKQLFFQLTTGPFTLNISMIHEFTELQIDWSEEWVDSFVKIYKDVIKILIEKGIQPEHAECLFISSPPSELQSLDFRTTSQRTREFLNLIEPYRVTPNTADFYKMLSHYIFYPKKVIFELTKDAKRLGIEAYNEKFLVPFMIVRPIGLEDFSVEHHAKERENVLARVEAIQKEYHFSEREIFDLYLEFLRLMLEDKEEEISRIFSIVEALKGLCFSLRKKVVYSFFLHRPPIEMKDVQKLIDLRVKYAQSEFLRELINTPDDVAEFTNAINEFLLKATQIMDPDNRILYKPSDIGLADKQKFKVDLRLSLYEAYFPSDYQQIAEQFQLSSVTYEKEMQLGGGAWGDRIGRENFFPESNSRSKYSHWSICNGRPTFYFSFNYIDKDRIESWGAFFSVDILVQEIAEERRRKPFYELLSSLARELFRAEQDISVRPKGADMGKYPWTHLPKFKQLLAAYNDDVKAGNLSEKAKEAIFKTIEEVMVAYRNYFLCLVANRPRPDFESNKLPRVAASGHIFPSDRRGCLLPSTHLKLAKKEELPFYLPDADEDFVKNCQILFAKRDPNYKSLGLSLKMAIGDELPISYKVEICDDLYEDPAQKDNQGALSKEEADGTYVTFRTFVKGESLFRKLRFPSEVLADPDRFAMFFYLLNLRLKMLAYKCLNIVTPPSSKENSEQSVTIPEDERKESSLDVPPLS